MFETADHQARKGILLRFAYFSIWLIYAALTEFVSFDAYWHMRMGEDFLYGSLAPGIDHYSYTCLNEPITGTPVIFQSILAVFSSSFGVPAGLAFLRLVGMSLFLSAIFLFYRSIRANWIIIALTLPYIVLFYLFRFEQVRPEMFGNVFIVMALILCIKTRADFSHKNLDLSMDQRTRLFGKREINMKPRFPDVFGLILGRVTHYPFYLLQMLGLEKENALVFYFEARPAATTDQRNRRPAQVSASAVCTEVGGAASVRPPCQGNTMITPIPGKRVGYAKYSATGSGRTSPNDSVPRSVPRQPCPAAGC